MDNSKRFVVDRVFENLSVKISRNYRKTSSLFFAVSKDNITLEMDSRYR